MNKQINKKEVLKAQKETSSTIFVKKNQTYENFVKKIEEIDRKIEILLLYLTSENKNLP